MIIWKLDELMRRRRLKGREVARAMGIGENYLSRVRHEAPDRLSLTLLNRLCSVLECSLSDLLEYRPDAPTTPETTWSAPLPAPVTLAASTVAPAPEDEARSLEVAIEPLEPLAPPQSWQALALAADAEANGSPALVPEMAAGEAFDEEEEAEKPATYVRTQALQSKLARLRRHRSP